MAIIARDTFTAANSTAITSRAGEVGATWTKNAAYSAATQTTYWGKAIGGGLIHPSGTPSTADYSVAVEFVQRSASGLPKLFARALNSALTGYCAEFAAATGLWTIKRYVSGGATQLGSSYSKPFVAGAHVHARLSVSGTGATVVLQLYLDGVLVIDTTDTSGTRLIPST